jgi:hypothetical protein
MMSAPTVPDGLTIPRGIRCRTGSPVAVNPTVFIRFVRYGEVSLGPDLLCSSDMECLDEE